MKHFSITFTFILFICICIMLNEVDAKKNKFKFKIKNKYDSHSHSQEHSHEHHYYRSGSNYIECEAEAKSEDWYGQKDKIEGGKQTCPIGVNKCFKFKCESIGFKMKIKGCGSCSDVYFEMHKRGETRFDLDRRGCTCEESDAKYKYEHTRPEYGSSSNKIYGPTVSILMFAIGVFCFIFACSPLSSRPI